jgi:hypothetical protein
LEHREIGSPYASLANERTRFVMHVLVVALGLVAGLTYVLLSSVRRYMVPLADLIVAARPLLVPVLVLAAAATINLPIWVQAAAAILLVLVVHRLIVLPEIERSSPELGKWWHAIENGFANALKKLAWVAGPGVALVWIAFSWLPSDWFLAGQGGLPAAALLVALLALVAALLVRLCAYATTPLRGVVSALLGVVAVSGLMAAGVLRGYDLAGSLATWFALAAAFGLAITIVFERIKPPTPSLDVLKRTERLMGLGLSLGMLSGVLLVFATALSMWVLSPHVTALGADGGAHATLYTAADGSLEYKYAPVLAFTHDQKWTPVKVDGYVARARVLRKDGSEAPTGHYECPHAGPRSCLRITIDCPTAAESCAEALPPHHPGAHVSDGAVYVRTLQRPGKGDRSDEAVALRGLFRPVSAVARDTQVLLQYWFFYRYDEWTTKALGVRLTQRHEGDWEAVTVGLDARNKPLFVAYSAHCGGTWERWKKTERFGSHPLVAVANGSQANYAEAGAKRPPDFTSCVHLPRGIGTLLAFAANVRDVTSDDWQWGAAEVVPASEKTWPMNFPGTWGRHDVLELKNARTFTTRSGGGPASPPLQPLWQDPIQTIFCSRYWDGPEPCRQA